MANVVAFDSDLRTFSAEAGEDLSSYQFQPVKWSSGQLVHCSSSGEYAVGILQNKPSAAGQAAVVAYQGISRVKLGYAVSQGNPLRSYSTTGVGPATGSTDFLLGYALSDGSATERIPAMLNFAQGYGTSLARGYVIRGSSAGAQEAYDANDTGKILCGDGTDIKSLALSGDLNAIVPGVTAAVTLSKKLIRASTTLFATALVKASNATPLVLLDHSAMVTATEIASGDVLIFHGAVLQIDGGAANFDNNQNFIAKYQTAGGGATVSLTLANFMNAGADAKMSTMKPIATDAVPEADQDIVLTSSVSPYTAAGDRALNVTTYYSVYTPV